MAPWCRVPTKSVWLSKASTWSRSTQPNPMKGIAGGIVDKTMPIHQSNVAIFNAATGKADRVGIKVTEDGKKVRVFKSTGEEIRQHDHGTLSKKSTATRSPRL